MTQRPFHDPPRAVPDSTAGEMRPALPLETILQDWPGALARVTAYLRAIGFAPADVRRLATRAVERALGRQRHDSAVADAIDEAERLLLETQPLAGDPREGRLAAFARWRFAAFAAGGVQSDEPLELQPLVPAPPLLRGPMVPALYRGRRLGERRHRRRDGDRYPEHERPGRRDRRGAREPWDARGRRRRALLFLLVLAPSIVAGAGFLATLPATVWYPVELAMAVAFGALFGWISVGFWTAVFGFMVLLRGGDRFAITKTEAAGPRTPLDPAARTAVVMPVKDESVERVFAGLRAVRASLERAGVLEACDLFILSDSADPDLWVDEEDAWARWSRETAHVSQGGIFYRHRRVRRKRKSGNVADFCRRYGRRYRYMVVLDADSVMSGECIARLVAMMERNPHVGIIQTAPAVVRARSLFARIQQFAARLYGPMFAAGMHYWQLGDSPYWGHNAIIRVEPFMQYCGLPRLAGKPPFGGDIMSHDFVEAALLGRARWSIWLAFDLPGSWEETPGSLLEEMQRDRRWCQGNLQHLRLLFTEGIVRVHRGLFLNGIFSYVSAVLWLGFLIVSTVEAVLWSLWGPNYFPTERSLFPTWPVWRPERIEALLGSVVAVLLLPKLLGFLLAVIKRRAAGFGGVFALLRSVLCETIASALFAPIRMLFYCRFVLKNMVGLAVTWRGGQDDLDETGWWTALRRHGPDTLVALAWAWGVRVLHPDAFWWLMPVAGALVLSIPVSVLASRTRLGTGAKRWGLFATPEETSPPAEIDELERELTAAFGERAALLRGFTRAVADPGTNAVHAWLLRGPRKLLPKLRAERDALVLRARDAGPDALTPAEKRLLLSDAPCMLSLHEAVWRLGDPAAAARWGVGR